MSGLLTIIPEAIVLSSQPKSSLFWLVLGDSTTSMALVPWGIHFGALQFASASGYGSFLPVEVSFPAEIIVGGFVECGGYAREICGDVMFVAVFADVAEQFLHFRNFHHAGAAESFQRVVGEFSFADVAADHAFAVDGGETRVAHHAAFYFTDRGAERIF